MGDWRLDGLLATWVLAGAAIGVARRWRRTEGIGLIAAYVLSLAGIHWIGAAVYWAPAFQFRDPTMMLIGFQQSTYGIVAFALGSIVGWPLLSSPRLRLARTEPRPGDPGLAVTYAIVGVLCYSLLVTGLAALPTARSLIAAGQLLVVLALCLWGWRAWQQGSPRGLAGTLLVAGGLPLVTIVAQGYLSYGAAAALVVCAFVASFYRPRWRLVAAATLVGYTALSFFVSYMRDRSDIRSAVWGGRPIEERLAQVAETVATLEAFDPSNVRHLVAVDSRLNQNYLVGVAVDRMRWIGGFAQGETLLQALPALVPRLLWPDKPYVAGSGDLVSTYTGFTFSADTSVGIGQVMEFYVNFGTVGVLGGFFVMGLLLTGIDEAAGRSLRAGDWHRLAPQALVGFSLLQVGGSLVDVAMTAGASIIMAMAATRIHRSWSRGPVDAVGVLGDPSPGREVGR